VIEGADHDTMLTDARLGGDVGRRILDFLREAEAARDGRDGSSGTRGGRSKGNQTKGNQPKGNQSEEAR
jgi:hypothetical protein